MHQTHQTLVIYYILVPGLLWFNILIEWLHKQWLTNADVLADMVVEAWDEFDAMKLTNISNRWEKVLHLIIKGDGSNDLVEKERGLKSTLFNPVEFPKVAVDCDSSDGDEEFESNQLVAM